MYTVVDPERILLGGPIGGHTALLEPVRTAVDGIALLFVRIEPGYLGDAAPLDGALISALEHGRSQLVPAQA